MSNKEDWNRDRTLDHWIQFRIIVIMFLGIALVGEGVKGWDEIPTIVILLFLVLNSWMLSVEIRERTKK